MCEKVNHKKETVRAANCKGKILWQFKNLKIYKDLCGKALICLKCDVMAKLSPHKNSFNFKPLMVMVLEDILTGRQARLEIQCLYGNPVSNNCPKTSLLKNS